MLKSSDAHNNDMFCKLEKERELHCEAKNKLAEVTKQRDTLAEAIKSAGMIYIPSSGGAYQTGWKDAVNWINQQALAATKGGSNE
jgi:hypothetical protein